MKVWHLLSNRWNSAITEYALSAARALEAAGHHSVFTPLAGSPAEKRAQAHLETRSVAHFKAPSLPALRALAREIAPDVVMTYGGPETVLAKWLTGGGRAKVVRFRGQAVETSGFAYRARHALSHTHVSLFVTPSASLAAALRTLGPAASVVPVTLGVDDGKFRRVTPLTWPPERPELVVLGRLDPVKGHAAMLALFAALLWSWDPGRPKPRLHIVGEPANLSVAELEREAKATGLTVGDDVLFTATRVSDVARLLSEAALGVVPSLGSEVICRVAEEFLLCGTPIAVSGAGSLDDVLAFPEAGVTWRGLHLKEAVELLRTWLVRSLEEGEAAKTKRAAKAAERFSLAAMGDTLARVLGDVTRSH